MSKEFRPDTICVPGRMETKRKVSESTADLSEHYI